MVPDGIMLIKTEIWPIRSSSQMSHFYDFSRGLSGCRPRSSHDPLQGPAVSGAGHSNEAPKESGVCLEMGPTPCFWTSDVVLSSLAPSALEPQSGSVTSSCPWYSAGPGKGDRLRSVCLSHVTSRGHRPRIIRFYTPVTPTMSGRSRSHKRWWNR